MSEISSQRWSGKWSSWPSGNIHQTKPTPDTNSQQLGCKQELEELSGTVPSQSLTQQHITTILFSPARAYVFFFFNLVSLDRRACSQFPHICKHLLNLTYSPFPNPAWTLQLYQATLGLLPRSSPIALSQVFSPMWTKSPAWTVIGSPKQRAGTDLVYEVPKGLSHTPLRQDARSRQQLWQHPIPWTAHVTASHCNCSLSHLQTLCTATHLYCTFLFNRCKINGCCFLRG